MKPGENNENVKHKPQIAKTTLVKKNSLEKVKEGLIADAGIDLKNYIFNEVVIPAGKDLVSNIIDSIFNTALGLKDTMLYGETRKRTFDGRRTHGGRRYVGYSSISRESSDREYKGNGRSSRFHLDDRFIFSSRAEADEVLEQMADTIEEYGVVSVFDLYDFCGETVEFTARDYGWDSVVNAKIQMIRGGDWEIILPRPVSLR